MMYHCSGARIWNCKSQITAVHACQLVALRYQWSWARAMWNHWQRFLTTGMVLAYVYEKVNVVLSAYTELIQLSST